MGGGGECEGERKVAAFAPIERVREAALAALAAEKRRKVEARKGGGAGEGGGGSGVVRWQLQVQGSRAGLVQVVDGGGERDDQSE